MKITRAIFIGILLWMIIFIEWFILTFALNHLAGMKWIIHFVLLVPISIFGAGCYYKKRNDLNGFVLGLIFVSVGIFLDMLITVPLFVQTYSYFIDYYRLSGFLEMVVLTGLYGFIER